MEVVDEQGRVLGAVNVVDALVVLLVLAAVVAGAALVLGGSDDDVETETRHVTVAFGSYPEPVAERLTAGVSAANPPADQNLTVTDVYVSRDGSGARIVGRLAVTAVRSDDGLRYDGGRLRIGRTLSFRTGPTTVNGTVVDVGGGADLPTGRTSVVLAGTTSAGTAASLEPGSTVTVGNRTVGRVSAVSVYDGVNVSAAAAGGGPPGSGRPGRAEVVLVANLSTLGDGESVRYGETVLRPNVSVTLTTGDAQFTGTVERVDDDLAAGTTDVLVSRVVGRETARALAVGDEYRVAGRTVATVEHLAVYGTADPDRKRVYAGLSLSTVGYAGTPSFGRDRPVTAGTRLPFRTDGYGFVGRVVRVGALEPRGEAATRTVTLEMRDLPPERATELEDGMAETAAGRTVAELTAVEVAPARVVVASDAGELYLREHPIQKRVTLTADLAVRETADAVWFKGRRLQIGGNVTLDLGSTSVRATVVEVE